MNTLTNHSSAGISHALPTGILGSQSQEKVSAQVGGLLSSLYPESSGIERRSDQRFPFPYLIHLMPVGQEKHEPTEVETAPETVVVVGKHLSARGIGFFHPKPLPYRNVIASFETGSGNWVSFLTELTWCRFTREGWYESGGRFLEAVDPPSELTSRQ
jgi:hypothetical protein